MKQNSFLKKFKFAIATVAVSTAFFALSPLSAFAANEGNIDYEAETINLGSAALFKEYSIDKGKTWYPIDATVTTINISKFIPTGKTDTELLLRERFSITRADLTTTYAANEGIIVYIPARPAASGVSYNPASGKFTTAVDATIDCGIYKIDDSNIGTVTFFTPVSTKLTYTLDGDDTAEKFKSSPGTITIAPLTKAPAVVFDTSRNVITKTTPAMQYTLDASVANPTWADCKPGSTDLSADIVGGDVGKTGAVRFKSPVSSVYTFSIAAISAAAPVIAANATDASDILADGYIDWDREVVKNNESKLQISLNKGSTWTDVNATLGTSIASAIKPATAPAATAVAEVQLRIAPANKTTAASKPVSIFINKRPATPAEPSLVTAKNYAPADPTISFGANTAYALSPTKITSIWTKNVLAATDVPFSTVKTNVDSTTDVLGKTLEIKTLPITADPYSVTPSSVALKYKLGTPAPAPAVTYTGLVGTYGSLRGATALMEAADNTGFTSSVLVTLNTDKLFELPIALSNKTIYVRIKGTDKAAPSLTKAISIPAVPGQVSGTAVDTTAIAAPLIAGADSTYEISFGTGSYVVYTKASLLTLLTDNGYKSAVGASPATSINIRKKATIASPAGTVRVVVAASRAS